MDTIVRGLPIPIIFLRERKTDLDSLEAKREVVDGQQRIRTLLSFIQSNLIKGFDPAKDAFTIKKTHNRDLADKAFKDLPPTVRQTFSIISSASTYCLRVLTTARSCRYLPG